MAAGVATAGAVEPDHEVVVVGAGFGGIGAAVKLQQAELQDFVILDAHHFDLDNYRFERAQESLAPPVQTTRRRWVDHLELVEGSPRP